MENGQRFEFGENWSRFLASINPARISAAESSLKNMLETDTLSGKTFLDIGSGSGLFSLAARRLGAKVRSFDYDNSSVACGLELKKRYCPNDNEWIVEQGSVLDKQYMASLGQFDVVYSWGVLHHTGSMYEAIDNAAKLAKPGGKFFIAIYNDQGGASRRWHAIKKLYNHSGKALKFFIATAILVFFEGRSALIRMAKLQNPLPFKEWQQRRDNRGMSLWTDIVDWAGGYPFEVAKPEDIFDFCRKRGFVLLRLTTACGGSGCNEYVFRKQ
jgi:2-polyprenyl-6-hydroxyphenyl methylase/3-demethylubiquinone-9 3-methyltransferase